MGETLALAPKVIVRVLVISKARGVLLLSLKVQYSSFTKSVQSFLIERDYE